MIAVAWRVTQIDADGFVCAETPWTNYAGAVSQWNALAAAGYKRILLEHTPIRVGR